MDNGQTFMAILIVFLVMAIPSAAFGAVLARRAGRPTWHGVVPGFFLPWIGLLFVSGAPSGRRYNTGPARYSMIMLMIAAVMTMISVFLPWVEGDGAAIGQSGEFAYSPHQVLVVAILVWLFALSLLIGSLGIAFKGGMAPTIATGVLVSGLGGLLLAVWYLWGAEGLFFEAARQQGADLNVHVGPGAWVALVALVTGYVALVVAPFGLKVLPDQQLAPQLPPQQWQPVDAEPAPSAWGQAPQQRGPGGPGATW